MAIERRYTGQPLQVDHTPETLSRIEDIANVEKVAKAAVVRDMIDAGLADRESQSMARYPAAWAELAS